MQQSLTPNHSEEPRKKSKKPSIPPRQAIYEAYKRRDIAENPQAGDFPTVIGNPHEEKTRITPGSEVAPFSEQPTVLRSAYEEKTRVVPENVEINELSDEDVVSYVSKVVQEQATRASQAAAEAAEQAEESPVLEHWVDTNVQDMTNPASPESIAKAEFYAEPEISISWEEDVDLSEFEETVNLVEFLKKNKLEGNDAYTLYNFLKQDYHNVELWEFIKKVAPKPIDYELFWHNFNLLSPLFIQALLVVGSLEEKNLDPETNTEETVYLVSISKLAQGGIGVVTNSYFCQGAERKLEPVLVKTALDNTEAKAVFPDEIKMARRVKTAIDKHPEDPRIKHVLCPKYIGRNFIVMPIITDQEGRSIPLNKLAPAHPDATQKWAHQILGAVKGNSFLTEQGIINVDFKPGNVLMAEEGGVIIDWGGFLEKYQLKKGTAEIWVNPQESSMFPFLNNQVALQQTRENWERMRGNVPRTPVYTSLHLLAMEMQEQISAGSLHKFALYRLIERFFARRFKIEGLPDYNRLSELDKLYQEPISLDPKNLSGADQLLYQLYLKLHQAHFHPYHFKEGNVKKGLDPEYVSNLDIIAALEEIANLKE